MKIRIRAIFLIAFINLIIILFSILTGIGYVRGSITRYIETDMRVVADIADRFISAELELLRVNADIIAYEIANSDRDTWRDILIQWEAVSPYFTGMAVFGIGGEIVSEAGQNPAFGALIENMFIEQAFFGKKAFTSTVLTDDGVFIYLASPLPGINGYVLVLTLPGTYFNDIVAPFQVWETGHIFIDDREGYIIANNHSEWVENRQNFIILSQSEPLYEPLANMLMQAMQGNTGIGYYRVDGAERICAYRPVSGSEEGWFLGVVAPLSESPVREVNQGLLIIGGIGFILGLIAAVAASIFITKPFEEIAALKEAAEESTRAKSEFLANMSHEIRTPMNAILGITDIQLQNENLPTDIKEAFVKIYYSGDILLSIINDILDFSKIEAGKLELAPAKYEISSLISDVVTLNLMRVGSKPIEFKLNIDENIPGVLIGDELRIKQILNNLLSNAFKYTEKGKVTLSVATEKEKENEITLVLTVSDTGRGMTEAQVNKLFDAYARFHVEKSRTIEGTGLGMSITHNLVHRMEGKIIVKSEPNWGTVFTVRVHQKETEAAPIGREIAESLMKFQISETKRMYKSQIVYTPMPYGSVLIVDDVESNLYVATGLLTPYKISIDTVISGYEAFEKIKEGSTYDIIFMDHMMPGMDGIETAKNIRGLGYNYPIVALTANAVVGQINIFMENGFDGFLSKPIDIRQLNATVKKFIRDRHPDEAMEAELALESMAADRKMTPHINDVLARSFIRDAEKAIVAMEAIYWDDSFEDEVIRRFTVLTHGMKSALINVLENEAANAAMKLEQAGHDKAVNIIKADLPAFLETLRHVIVKLTAREPENTNEKEAMDYNYLHEQLHAIITACGMYDKRTAKILLSGLGKKVWPKAVRVKIDEMTDLLLSGDYGDVIQTAEVLLNGNI